MQLCEFFFHIDIDECAEDISGCHHNCTNTEPGYYCFCDAGYTLNGDGHACDGEDNADNMLYCTCMEYTALC